MWFHALFPKSVPDVMSMHAGDTLSASCNSPGDHPVIGIPSEEQRPKHVNRRQFVPSICLVTMPV
jgi:hypothetical protein